MGSRQHGTRGHRVHEKDAAVLVVPTEANCAWRTAGFPRSGAGRRRQPRYEGSDRQARGQILTVLRESETAVDSDLLVDMSTDRDQMLRALESLESDGLVRRVGGAFALPF